MVKKAGSDQEPPAARAISTQFPPEPPRMKPALKTCGQIMTARELRKLSTTSLDCVLLRISCKARVERSTMSCCAPEPGPPVVQPLTNGASDTRQAARTVFLNVMKVFLLTTRGRMAVIPA